MTVKDLNFSFDSNLVRSPVVADRDPAGDPGRADRTARPAPGRPSRGRRKPVQAERRATGGRGQLAATIGIALVNMLFLVVAGIWLSGYFFQPAGLGGPAALVEDDRIAPLLVELNSRVGALEQQLADLQVSTVRQQQTIISSQQSMEARLTAQWEQALTAREPKPEAAPAEPPAAPAWYVNLGDYVSREGAAALERQMLDLGYRVEIETRTEDSRIIYRVTLPGFVDQASADQAAQGIMEQTSLNGLWVATRD